MERANYAKKNRISLYLIIAVVAIAALAAGIYFIVSGSRSKEPNRGTYVINMTERSRNLEKTD
ncbi:MAG: hypothetical protein ACOYIF_02445 [Acetivibrionales bacterium]|jgi:flagellar basal body-associated protein FliL